MALNAYLTLKGKKQGAIRGSVTEKGRANSILVHAYSNEIVSPRDAASGLPTGKRMHKPVVILKEVDRSSPPLRNAFVNNETLTTWQLKFWAMGADGVERQTYTISLVNASIASMHEFMLDNEEAGDSSLPLHEEIAFTYQKIEWVWNDGGLTAQDDWETPVAS